MASTSDSFSFKEALVVIAVSGVTTLNVRSSCFAIDAVLIFVKVLLGGALTVALPTIGKDLGFKQVRVLDLL